MTATETDKLARMLSALFIGLIAFFLTLLSLCMAQKDVEMVVACFVGLFGSIYGLYIAFRKEGN